MKSPRHRFAAIAGLGLAATGICFADGPLTIDLDDHSPYVLSENLSLDLHPNALQSVLSYRGGQSDSNRTILIISGVVLVVGLVDSDSALTIIGGAGVIYSLASSGQMGFRQSAFHHGLEFAQSGPLSFGLNGFGQYGISHENAFAHPGAYVQASFKF